jgi:hypothetical protein
VALKSIKNQKSKIDMEISEEKKKEILLRAEWLMYYNELLIKQCDSWLSAEEGNANMMKEYMKRYKSEPTIWDKIFTKIWDRIFTKIWDRIYRIYRIFFDGVWFTRHCGLDPQSHKKQGDADFRQHDATAKHNS